MGNSVNLASHLESIAQPDEILISETTYNLVKSQVKCIERLSTKFQWLSKDLRLFSAHKIPNQ
jgi:class 3 adenylate cyclase